VTLAPQEVKACCASAYSSSAARWLLGDHFHPGGAELTARLAEALRVGRGNLVVDLASGPGTSAIQLALEVGCDVVGVDLAAGSVAVAARRAEKAGLSGAVRFIQGDAEALPLEDESADGVLCECALCTFPDKATAVSEVARVLRPGSRLALSDVTAVADELPPQLTSLNAWVACIADARPLDEIAALIEDGGLVIETSERHDHELAAMLDDVDARLRTARMLGLGLLGARIATGRELVAAARESVSAGLLGYGVIVARRG